MIATLGLLSTTLFNYAIDWMKDILSAFKRRTVQSTVSQMLNTLMNIVLFANNYDEMQILVNNALTTAVRIGLSVNKKKAFSSYMREADKMLTFTEIQTLNILGPLQP